MNSQVHLSIKKIRLLRNYTQEYLAAELRISQKAYSDLESGKTKIDIYRLDKVCQVLDISIESILKYDDKMLFDYFKAHESFQKNTL